MLCYHVMALYLPYLTKLIIIIMTIITCDQFTFSPPACFGFVKSYYPVGAESNFVSTFDLFLLEL